MTKPLVAADLWHIGAPRLPPEPTQPHGDRPRNPDRGVDRDHRRAEVRHPLAPKSGCGSGMPCWRRACVDSARIPAKQGARHRPGSDESPQGPEGAPHEAPPWFEPARPSPHLVLERRKCARLDRLRAPPRHPAGQATPGPATETFDQAECREGLRYPALPPRLHATPQQDSHRPQVDRLQLAARSPPLGDRAHAGLARPVPALDGPLRTAPGHFRGFPCARLLTHLLQSPPSVLVEKRIFRAFSSRDFFNIPTYSSA
jgi:hypothetical protein